LWHSDFKTTTLIEQTGPMAAHRKYATIVARSDWLDDPVFGKAGLLFSGPKWAQLSFDELLEKPHKIHTVKRVTDGAREMIFVELSNETARLELWFDPAVNYLVRKKVSHALPPPGSNADEQKGAESTVTRFKEVTPTLFFPEEMEVNGLTPDGRSWTTVYSFSDIQINRAVPADVFRVTLPHGIQVSDNIQNKMFQVEANGNLRTISDLSPAQVAPLPTSGEKLFQTRYETRPWHWWLLPGSLGILALAGIGWIIRWRRGQPA